MLRAVQQHRWHLGGSRKLLESLLIDLDVSKHRADPSSMLHERAILAAVHREDLGFGDIVNRSAEQHHQAIGQCIHAGERLLVARRRLSNQHGVASHALLHFGLGATAQKELPHNQSRGAGEHPGGERRFPVDGRMPSQPEVIRECEGRHRRLLAT